MAVTVSLPADFGPLLQEIKGRVQLARIKVGLAANRELLALYRDIGRLIVRAQESRGYGKKVVEHLAADLQRFFPGVGGFGFKCRESGLLVQALKALGKERIDDAVIATLRKHPDEATCKRVQRDTVTVTGWVYEAIKRIYGERG